MAVAKVKKCSNLCVSTHIGQKEDEEGTLIMTIKDIKRKIGSAEPTEQGKWFESGVLECGDIEFKLIIWPNGITKKAVGNISCGIATKNRGKRQWRSVELLVAQNSSGAFLKTRTELQENFPKNDEKFKEGFHCPKALPHALVLAVENATFFPNGILTVKVNIKVEGEETVTINTTKLPEESITSSQLKGELSMHFGKMLDSPQFSDVQILCQGEMIPCHRNVLAARTPYFEAMFEHDMKENTTREVEIKDFDLETVKAVVHHIYTGEVECNDENSEKMMRAADKYQLGGLKTKLEDVLIKAVRKENALDMFVLGDGVHADKLRDLSKEVIVKNAVAIVEADDEWKEKLGRFHDLTLEMFEAVVKSKKTQTK